MLRMRVFRINRFIRRTVVLVVFTALVGLVAKFFSNVYYNAQCNNNILKLKENICEGYHEGRSIGTLCPDLCSIYSTSFIKFTSCPNMYGHNGKEIVVALEWKGYHVIMKARTVHEKDMIAGDASVHQLQIQHSHYVMALNRLMNDTFPKFGAQLDGKMASNPVQETTYSATALLPFDFNGNLSSVNVSSLRNTYLLAQDNEYVLSQTLFKSHKPDLQIFPKVLSTCGHFYVVEYSDEILDLSFMSPSSLRAVYSRSLLEKVNIALKLVKFLQKLITINSGLELCDVKFEHFGQYESTAAETDTQLFMIDSDMIYHRAVARENIKAIDTCESHRDCDFIDCQGICSRRSPDSAGFIDSVHNDPSKLSHCDYDTSDNNLKRICRNMFFMGTFGWNQMGLLPELESLYAHEIGQIKDLCNLNVSNVNRDTIDTVAYLLERIKSKLSGG